MAADAALARAPLVWRYPPAGTPLLPGLLRSAAEGDLAETLATRLGAARVDLFASGREALRQAFLALAAERGRDEIVVPAYTCYSVAAAAVAAKLRVRLVDVTPHGAIDVAALERLPLERAAAVVVCNLFGVPEPVGAIARLAASAGMAVIDDAAQSFGAQTDEGAVGTRGSVGVLSFARGKPLAAMGGGALVWRDLPVSSAPPAPTPRRLRAGLLAFAHDLALAPFAFGWVAALPGLHVGETPFEPEFERGGLSGAAICLVQAKLATLEADNAERRRHAEALAAQIRQETPFEPVLAAPGQGVYPRLVLVAPDPARRDEALARLMRLGAGASAMYPASLDSLPALAPHRAGTGEFPGARGLAARILTVPAGISAEGRRGRKIVAALAE